MKTRSIVMTLGLLIAGWLAFFGDKTNSSDVAEAVVRSSASALAAAKTARATPAPRKEQAQAQSQTQSQDGLMIAALQPRELLLETTEAPMAKAASMKIRVDAAPEAATDVLFGVQSWTPPPPPPPKPGPPPPPVAPPLPFVFLGKKLEDQIWEVYLSSGENTFIAREKTVIEQQYRIDEIKPPTLTVTYLPLNQVQTLNIGGTD